MRKKKKSKTLTIPSVCYLMNMNRDFFYSKIQRENTGGDMLKAGLTLLVMGMGTVFFFLVILIFTMVITHKVLTMINKIFPEAVIETAPVKKVSSSNDEEIAVAIAALQRL